MDVGKEREHACMDVGSRVTQEQLPRSGSFASIHWRTLKRGLRMDSRLLSVTGRRRALNLSLG